MAEINDAQNNTAHIGLLWKKSTCRAVLAAALDRGQPYFPKHMQLMGNMKNVAQVFNSKNINLLCRLRALGHVSLKDAASALGFVNDEAFVMRTLDGLNLFLDFCPLPNGRPGVKVSFTKLIIDLDIETRDIDDMPESSPAEIVQAFDQAIDEMHLDELE